MPENLPTVNRSLVEYLRSLAAGNQQALSALTGYVATALAAEQTLDALSDEKTNPVLGFFITSNEEMFIANLVAPGRYTRMEFARGQFLAVTVPLARVARVVDEQSATTASVTVEIDAQGLTGTATSPTDGRPAAVAFALPTYVLRAETSEQNGHAVAQLAAFSAALRRSMANWQ